MRPLFFFATPPLGATVGYGKPRNAQPLACTKKLGAYKVVRLSDETEDDNHPGWDQDEEILINYGPDALRDCKCTRCFVPPLPVVGDGNADEEEDDDDTGSEPQRKWIKV